MANNYVGLFFFINNRVVAKKLEVCKGVASGDYINHPKSHFEFFIEISNNPLDDYGHYPRGRIIYNQKSGRFLVYIDKTLNKKYIKELILKEFNLDERICEFRKDIHYTHDWL